MLLLPPSLLPLVLPMLHLQTYLSLHSTNHIHNPVKHQQCLPLVSFIQVQSQTWHWLKCCKCWSFSRLSRSKFSQNISCPSDVTPAPDPPSQPQQLPYPHVQWSQLLQDPVYPGFPKNEKGEVEPLPPYSFSQKGEDLPQGNEDPSDPFYSVCKASFHFYPNIVDSSR